LGTETHLGANWESQTCTHRIREEREGATCQYLTGPLQHDSATCQHLIGPPHPCGSHMSDKWVPLVPRVSTSLVHITSHITTSATWQPVNGPHEQLLHQTETHGSLWLSHLSSQVPRGTLPLVHVSKWAPPRHKSPDRWAPPQCHVAVNQWSTSSQCMPHDTTTGVHFNMHMPHGTATSSHLNPAVPHGSSLLSHLSSINRSLRLKRG
jgi:hypothetical protein